MDECSSKRHIGGLAGSRKATTLVSRDMTDNSKQDAQFCNRIGCSGRLKYTKDQVGLAQKPKYSKPSFRSPNSKEIIGSSSRTNTGKSNKGSQIKFSSHLENDSSESSSVQDDADIPENIPSTSRNQKRFQTEIREGNATKVSLPEVGSPSAVSEDKSIRVFHRKPTHGCQNGQPGISVSSTSNSVSAGARSDRQGSRYLKNLKCNSISDIIPQAGSPSRSKVDRREVKKRSPEGESSSSSRGKRSNGSKFEDGRIPLSPTGISISSARQIRNPAANSDSTTTPGRMRRSFNSNTRMRFSNHDNFNLSSLTESTSTIPELSLPHRQIDASVNGLMNQSNILSPYGTSGSSNDNSPSVMPVTSAEQGVSHALRRHNLDGVAEMLMALERIEQDEELSYEQLLSLETNLLIGSLNLYDQHREMRLDIDNMSYEELLALEERMGTVSTAVPEEALAKCLTITIYQNPSLELEVNEHGTDEDEIKCSICQEEFVIGDEIGQLACNHGCHCVCIQQWLRLKNWCPICKVSAIQSSPSSPA